MPPAVSDRWKYFTKGLHPNPPISDGRSAGAPHTPMHPCSNPKLFWVQCNFCIERNNGQFLNDDKAWMKSREEQMMYHLKTCCNESRQAWDDIMDWKCQKKTSSTTTTGKIPNTNKKRAARTVSSEIQQQKAKQPRLNDSVAGKSESGVASAAVAAASSSNNSRGLSSSLEQGKLKPTQLRNFHKMCTIAVASRKLDFTFFEDPIIVELINILRPGVVSSGQLPSQQLLIGDTGDGSENLIKKYASDQVASDMVKIIRAMKRCEGMKSSILCNVSKEATAGSKIASATFLCGGEHSCIIVPAMQEQAPSATDGGISNGQEGHLHNNQDPAVALAAKVEAQLWSMGDVLGRYIQRDESKNGDKKTAVLGQDSEEQIKSRQSTGIMHIGSCLLAKCSRESIAEYSAHTMSRAHGILSIRWPMIFFTSNGCFSEQMNLLLKDLLTKIPSNAFLEPLEHAISTICVLQELQSSASSSASAQKWLSNFENVIHEVYFGSKTTARENVKNLLKIDNSIYYTSWTSTQRRLAYLLRIRTGCYTFATQYSIESDFPDECRVFTDREFWESVVLAEKLIRPLGRAALKFVPEKDMSNTSSIKTYDDTTISTTMADVVFTFYALYSAWCVSGSSQAANLVEKRWKHYENPWMILAFIFHPAYSQEAQAFLQKQSKEDGLFSAKYLSNAILAYTVKYMANELTADPPLSIPVLKRQATEYMDRLERGEVESPSSLASMKKDWKEYWSFQTSTPELAKFVLFLLSVSVQTATVDEMFQNLAVQHMEITNNDGNEGTHRGFTQRVKLKEQLEILENAAKPVVQKWRVSKLTRKGPFTGTPQIIDPTEQLQAETDGPENRLPSAVSTPALSAKHAATELSTNTRVEAIYDPEEDAKIALEAKVVAKLSGTNGRAESNSNRDMTPTRFWSTALDRLREEDDNEYNGAIQEESQNDELDERATISPTLVDNSPDDDLPQFTVPAYATATTATSPKNRKARRTYRPEQIHFDFMKGWADTRNHALLSPGDVAPEVENVSQLKNYRANKIKLDDFFDNDAIPPSFGEFISQFDPDPSTQILGKKKK